MGVLDEFKSRNFSLYAQWGGVISIILLIVLGAICLTGNVPFSIIGWVFAFILFFVEVPLCIRFCPTSPRFDSFVSKFENSYLRAGLYLVMAIIMFLSTTVSKTILLLPAVILLFTSIFYLIAAVKQQPHASSKILGGTGVDNVV
ncbi:hypothetical protein BJ944DRAFT_265115 [Cunninghamella echinulata]|nr:hypothetical protein BJ944DRAFT_265115 [Cunninghamella echinulata]